MPEDYRHEEFDDLKIHGLADLHFKDSLYSADMYFDKVEVPLSNIIVPAGGFPKLMEAFDLERCGNTTMSIAVAQSAFDCACSYVQERRQFGKAVIDFQAKRT